MNAKKWVQTCEIKRAYISLGSQTLQGQKCIEQKLEFEEKTGYAFCSDMLIISVKFVQNNEIVCDVQIL